MAEVILMPRLSDQMTEGVVTYWHKKVGDKIKRGDLLAEIETDKATMELDAYKEGSLLYIPGGNGTSIQVHGLVAIIGQPGEDISSFFHESHDVESISFPISRLGTIFLSYSRKDYEFAIKLGSDVRKAGGKVWIDSLDIKPGQIWHKEIQNALSNAGTFLVILSDSSVESEHVLNEIYYAIAKKKHIIPIVMKNCEIPIGLFRLHYLDFRNNYDEAYSQLLQTLLDKVEQD